MVDKNLWANTGLLYLRCFSRTVSAIQQLRQQLYNRDSTPVKENEDECWSNVGHRGAAISHHLHSNVRNRNVTVKFSNVEGENFPSILWKRMAGDVLWRRLTYTWKLFHVEANSYGMENSFFDQFLRGSDDILRRVKDESLWRLENCEVSSVEGDFYFIKMSFGLFHLFLFLS